jgi:uncharacterized protein (TIGR03083 family)
MKPVAPIKTVKLFPRLSAELLSVLRELGPADWDRPTACQPWTVKDVAAHLLGGSLGRLRPRPDPPAAAEEPILDYQALVSRINQENELWVLAARRISPQLLIEFLARTDDLLYEHFRALDPDGPAGAAVAWAGDRRSPVWFDVAREYTEKWLHQQHIRDAVGRPLLLSRRWYSTVLDTFLRGLPYTYRSVAAAKGTTVSVRITGEAGGDWTLRRGDQAWELLVGDDPAAASRVRLDQDMAWRLFSRGVDPDEASPRVRIEGNEDLARPVLHMVSIMA